MTVLGFKGAGNLHIRWATKLGLQCGQRDGLGSHMHDEDWDFDLSNEPHVGVDIQKRGPEAPARIEYPHTWDKPLLCTVNQTALDCRRP